MVRLGYTVGRPVNVRVVDRYHGIGFHQLSSPRGPVRVEEVEVEDEI